VSFLEKTRELEKAATPGPWRFVKSDTYCASALIYSGDDDEVDGDDDLALIVYLRNSLPEILATVRAARGLYRACPREMRAWDWDQLGDAIDAIDAKADEEAGG